MLVDPPGLDMPLPADRIGAQVLAKARQAIAAGTPSER